MRSFHILFILFFTFFISAVSAQELPDNIISADCYGNINPTEWSITEAWRSSQGVCTLVTPVIGDLDGDGIPEIVTAGFSYDDYLTEIFIFNGADRDAVKNYLSGVSGCSI